MYDYYCAIPTFRLYPLGTHDEACTVTAVAPCYCYETAIRIIDLSRPSTSPAFDRAFYRKISG